MTLGNFPGGTDQSVDFLDRLQEVNEFIAGGSNSSESHVHLFSGWWLVGGEGLILGEGLGGWVGWHLC